MLREAEATVETTLRRSYGKLIAFLTARSGDVAGAEDALSDAFAAALVTWRTQGIPENPEAWLLTAARRKHIDTVRRQGTTKAAAAPLALLAEERSATDEPSIPDNRLALMFVCAHPAIDPAVRTPLMLQTILGFDAATIASAFLTSPAAMSQRLVRTKNKIRDAAIPFRIPDPPEWRERLAFVLDAIYAAYTTGWQSLPETASTHHALAAEAIALGRLLVQLMPREAEAHGLLALMLHCQARRAARYTSDGKFVPLDQQDPAKWSGELMQAAEEQLHLAAGFKSLGRFQLEAAIQSVHASRAKTGRTEWREIALLYAGLIQIAPSIGALVGRAVALAQTGDSAGGLAALDDIPAAHATNYQPYWAARGHLLGMLKREAEARQSWERAAGLTDDPALREYLTRRAPGPVCMI